MCIRDRCGRLRRRDDRRGVLSGRGDSGRLSDRCCLDRRGGRERHSGRAIGDGFNRAFDRPGSGASWHRTRLGCLNRSLFRFGSGCRSSDTLFDRRGGLHHRLAGGKFGGRRRRWCGRRRRGRHYRRGRGRRGHGGHRFRRYGRGDRRRGSLGQQRGCGQSQNSGNRGPGGAVCANISSHSRTPTAYCAIQRKQRIGITTNCDSLAFG